MVTKKVLVMTVVLGIAAAAAAAQENRVFELRTYFSPPGRLDDLHARFRDHTLKLFEKHGMTSIGYWVPIENPEETIYLYARGYWLARYLEEEYLELFKQLLAGPAGQNATEAKMGNIFNQTPDEFWRSIDQRLYSHWKGIN